MPAGRLLTCGALGVDFQWPKKVTPPSARRRGPFKTGYDATFHDVERELDMINAHEAEALFDVVDPRRGLRRLDTRPYFDARMHSPRVVVRFTKGAVPLIFPCDSYDDWLANLRAISLTLTALRAVDRYGATAGEQYKGFRALPPGGGVYESPSDQSRPRPAMSPRDAAEVLIACDPASHDMSASNRSAYAQNLVTHPHIFRIVEGIALKASHPDTGGDRVKFDEVQRARAVLAAHHKEMHAKTG